MQNDVQKNEIAELTEFLIGQFGKVEERFTKMDERFDKMDERFASLKEDMDNGFARIEGRLSKLEDEVADIKAKLDRHLQAATEDQAAIVKDYEKLKKRVEILEAQIKALTANQPNQKVTA